EPTGARREPGPSGGRPAALYRFRSPRLEITDQFAVLRPPASGLARSAPHFGRP
ncbi:MAG: NUDIX hydrolase, partial [Gaiellaceae bacterium]